MVLTAHVLRATMAGPVSMTLMSAWTSPARMEPLASIWSMLSFANVHPSLRYSTTMCMYLCTSNDQVCVHIYIQYRKDSQHYCYHTYYTQGTLCEIDLDKCHPSPCSNGATCVNDANEADGYRCECAPSFFGLSCNSHVCDSMCFNGATCIAYVSV